MANKLGPGFWRTPPSSPQKPNSTGALVCLALAVLSFRGAFYAYDYLSVWERTGGPRYMNAIATLLYAIAGKNGVAALFVAGGVFMSFAGILVLCKLVRQTVGRANRIHVALRGVYQVLLVLLLIAYPLRWILILTKTPQVVVVPQRPPFIPMIGLLLQPACAIGLWYDKVWGALLLLLAAVLCLFSCFTALGAIIVLPLAAVRLIGVKRRELLD